MALDTLVGLTAAVGDWTGRRLNAAFNANVPDFIAMAETRIFNGSGAPMETPAVRVLAMESTKALSVIGGAAKLPSNFLEFKRVSWDGSTPKIDYKTPREFHSIARTGSAPTCFTIEGDKILLSPASDGKINTTFYARFDALAAPDDTNWLMSNAPAVYLQATLIEAWSWIGAPDRMQTALAAYRGVVAALNTQHLNSRTRGETARIRGNMW